MIHKNKDFCALGLAVLAVLIVGSGVTLGDDSNKNTDYVTFHRDADKTQEISIFVQPRAETGDSDTSADETAPVDESVASSLQDCGNTGDCCYQYTWAGSDLEVPTTAVNNSCEWLKSSKGKTIACFDPLVYVRKEENRNGGPSIEELKEGANERPDWTIFCKRGSGRSCMRYRFYSNSKDKELVNETLFCGSVSETSSGSGKAVTNGCFREKIMGVQREICVCDDKDLCNEGEKKYLNLMLFTSTVFLTLIFYH